MKLLVSDYEVVMANEDSNNEFFVKFSGPKESPYEEVSRVGARSVPNMSNLALLKIKFKLYKLIEKVLNNTLENYRAYGE